MAFYECVFIARQDISADQVNSLTEQMEKVLGEGGGKVEKKENWGLRTLTYRINKNRKGHYVLMNLDAPAAAVHEMERQMRLNEDILRYMTIRVDELEEGPSAILQNKDRNEKGDRGDRGDRRRRDNRGDNRDNRGDNRENRNDRQEGAQA